MSERRFEVGGRELTAEQAVALLKRYKTALEGLTAGGSEFVNDPEFCLKHIKERRESFEKLARIKGYRAAIEAAAQVIGRDVVACRVSSMLPHSKEIAAELEKVERAIRALKEAE